MIKHVLIGVLAIVLSAGAARAQDAAAPSPAEATPPAPVEAPAPAPAEAAPPPPADPPSPPPADAPPPPPADPAGTVPLPETVAVPVEAAPPAEIAAPLEPPQQVSVSVKIIEFQTSSGLETGLSAYFRNHNKDRVFGKVSPGVQNADITFPNSTDRGINVFLDRLSIGEGELEVLLQALVQENRASIFSKPKAMVMVGDLLGTTIGTTREIPYEETAVVATGTVQATNFQTVGVSMTIRVPTVIDDDADWSTTNDTFIMLSVDTKVSEEGGRFTIALDDNGNFINAPEFIDRSIMTHVWVRHGQVLILGGLFRNANTESLDTVPWLTRAEDMAVGLAERLIPGNFLASPISASVGNREKTASRRELVFIIKAESWRPPFVVREEHGFTDSADDARKTPTDVIQDVLQDISEIPEGIAEGITGQGGKKGDVERELGGR